MRNTRLLLTLLFSLMGPSSLIACGSSNPDQMPYNAEFHYGVIDSKGHFVIAPIYHDIYRVKDNKIYASKKREGKEDSGVNGYDVELDLQGNVISEVPVDVGIDWSSTFKNHNNDIRRYAWPTYNIPGLLVKFSKEKNKFGFVNEKGA